MAIGIVTASENITDNSNIENLIDECEDQGTIKLDEKTYELNPEKETHLYLNKSITIEGKNKKTVIDGKKSTLFLDVEQEKPEYNNGTAIFAKDIYDVKNTGKHIILKNITFKDLNLISRHKMDFIDCKFIKTNFTSKELNNSIENCVFNESKIELNQYDMTKYKYYSKIINSTFNTSTISSNTNLLLQIDGSSRVFMQNSIDLKNSILFNSNILLSHYNINMNDLKLNNSNLKGGSDNLHVTNTSFNNSTVDIEYSDVNYEKTNLNNSKLTFQGGYYSKGCEVTLKNTITNNSTFEFIPNFYSEQSILKIENSSVKNGRIKTTETNIKVNNSNFNKTTIESISSNLNINNSKFYNNENISQTIIIYSNELVNTSNIIENSYLINNTGKYEIKNQDINIDTLYRLSFDKNATYYINDNITFNIKDHNGNPVSNVKLFIENPNDPYTTFVFTDENGNANYTLNTIGKLNFTIYYYDNELSFFESQKYPTEINLTVNPKINDIKLNKNIKSVKYSKINGFLKGKIVNNYSEDLSGLNMLFKVYSDKKYKRYTEKTNANGEVVFEIPKKLDAGVHKIEVIVDNKIMKTTSIKIQKARTIVKAPKVTNKVKKSSYFKVTVKNKETKKLLSKVKVKIKVFTGKKFKTYSLKTDKKGIAKINTKNLKKGTHKVLISSANNNYEISAKSTIKIEK